MRTTTLFHDTVSVKATVKGLKGPLNFATWGACVSQGLSENLQVLVYSRISPRGLVGSCIPPDVSERTFPRIFPAPYQDWSRLERKELIKFASGNLKCKS